MSKRSDLIHALQHGRKLVEKDLGPSYERVSEHQTVVGESDSHKRERMDEAYCLSKLERALEKAFLQDGLLDTETQGDLIELLGLAD